MNVALWPGSTARHVPCRAKLCFLREVSPINYSRRRQGYVNTWFYLPINWCNGGLCFLLFPHESNKCKSRFVTSRTSFIFITVSKYLSKSLPKKKHILKVLNLFFPIEFNSSISSSFSPVHFGHTDINNKTKICNVVILKGRSSIIVLSLFSSQLIVSSFLVENRAATGTDRATSADGNDWHTFGFDYQKYMRMHALSGIMQCTWVHDTRFVKFDIICSSKYMHSTTKCTFAVDICHSAAFRYFPFWDINLLFLLNSNFHIKAKINDIVLFTRHFTCSVRTHQSIYTYRRRFDIIYIQEVQ